MEKTWMDLAPSSERIIEDIDRLPEVLDKIIAAEGCVVPDEFLRTGRRAKKANGDGMCKGKSRKRSRKATQEAKKHHPELEEAYKILLKADKAKRARPRA